MSLDMEKLADVIDAAIERRVEPLRKRIAELESREVVPGPKGDPGADGKSISVEEVRDIVEAITAKEMLQLERRNTDYLERIEVRDGIDGRDGADGKDGAPGMDGRDGQDADEKAIAKRVLEVVSSSAHAEVQKAIAAIPQVKDGRDGKDGQDGRDADEEEILSRLRKDAAVVIERTVSEEVAKIPVPQDGRDGIDATPEMVEASVAKLIEPKFAAWELHLERKTFDWMERQREEIRKMFDAMPKPKDGKDGLSVKDFQFEYDGERTLLIKAMTEAGEVVHKVYLPIPLYREVWKSDFAYQKHDMVTHDGSTWIAMEDSEGKRPGHMQKTWKLIVKKGRDGK